MLCFSYQLETSIKEVVVELYGVFADNDPWINDELDPEDCDRVPPGTVDRCSNPAGHYMIRGYGSRPDWCNRCDYGIESDG